MQKYFHPVKFRGAEISPKAKLFNQGKKNTKRGNFDHKNPRSGFSALRRNLATLQNKSVNRFWGNAARLEHSNVRNKNKGKKR